MTESEPGQNWKAEVCRRTEIDLLSCNRDPIWPDLEHTSVHAPAHTWRVTGHKEPLCQVTEHREKDKGLEGCDMTNMRSFAGLRGDWHYSQGWVTLLICITHHCRSPLRRVDQPHTWSMDTKPTVCAEQEERFFERKCLSTTPRYAQQIGIFLNLWRLIFTRLFFSFPSQKTRRHHHFYNNISLQPKMSSRLENC